MSRPKRVKKMPPPEPPRDPRLVAIAEQASRLEGWVVEWQLCGDTNPQWWLRLHSGCGVEAEAFDELGSLSCYAHYSGHWSRPAQSPLEALRSAYAALGVALDQADDAFGGAP